MNRRVVSSSNVASVGYDATTQTLEVEFLNGSVYQYYDVPEHMFESMMRAPSKGVFLNANIKDRYAYSRVG